MSKIQTSNVTIKINHNTETDEFESELVFPKEVDYELAIAVLEDAVDRIKLNLNNEANK